MKLVKCDMIVHRDGYLVPELLTTLAAPTQEELCARVDAFLEEHMRRRESDKFRLVFWEIAQDTEFQSPKDLLSLIDFRS